jgi:hypothetical protein
MPELREHAVPQGQRQITAAELARVGGGTVESPSAEVPHIGLYLPPDGSVANAECACSRCDPERARQSSGKQDRAEPRAGPFLTAAARPSAYHPENGPPHSGALLVAGFVEASGEK